MSDALRHEIDYMKSLVEAGANRPLGNGAALFWAGLVFGTAASHAKSLVYRCRLDDGGPALFSRYDIV